MSEEDGDNPRETNFFNRWSARKKSVQVAEPVASSVDSVTTDELSSHPIHAPALGAAEQSVSTTEEASDELAPLLSDEDMPALETLTADSDLSDFFNRGVSAALRRKALRHVFALPIYNVRDGLNDYDDDYTVFEPLGDTVTCDMKWHKARKEREEREKAEAKLAAEQEEREQLDAEQNDQAELEQEQDSAHEPVEEDAVEPLDDENTDPEIPPATPAEPVPHAAIADQAEADALIVLTEVPAETNPDDAKSVS